MAVILELYTIPLYLFAAYSIIVPDDQSSTSHETQSFNSIIGVVHEEMLHLGLAGNILCAIGGQPLVYGTGVTPTYPQGLFYQQAEVHMELKGATKGQIEVFVNIEEPLANKPVVLNPDRDEYPLGVYGSIGDFYDDICIGLMIVAKKFNDKGSTIWQENTGGKQFQTGDGSSKWSDMIVIKDLATTETSLEIIVSQGEGQPGVTQDPSSHYCKFEAIAKNAPACYPVVKNPITGQYNANQAYKAMLLSDVVYSFLLWTMEKLWERDRTLSGRKLITGPNMPGLMTHIISPLTKLLVTQKLDVALLGVNAAAPFNLYTFNAGSTPLQQVNALYAEALKEYNDMLEYLKVLNSSHMQAAFAAPVEPNEV